MVKNVFGGNKHKSQARKNTNSGFTSKTRISLDPCEVYAQVSKLLGSCMCHVMCQDGIMRLCHIRGKFSGRGKRDNMLTSGKWVLVGLREYESGPTKKGKLENCDVLEVYSDQDKERLKAQVSGVNWKLFVETDGIKSTEDDGFVFSDEREEEYDSIIEKAGACSDSSTRIDLKPKTTIALGEEEEEEDINVDDI
jgi:translation initiation factor 1A